MNIAVVGQPCSGKTSLVRALEKEGYRVIIPHTTRPMRDGEVHGVDYVFIPRKGFKTLFAYDHFAEVTAYKAAFGECYYGTSKYEYCKKGNAVVALNPRAVLQVADDVHVVYLDIPESRLIKRAKERGDDMVEIKRRIRDDKAAFDHMVATLDVKVHITRQTKLEKIIERVKNIKT